MRSRAILPAFAAVALLPAVARDCDPPPPNPPDHFETVQVGEPLPTGAACANRVDDAPEVRPSNNTYNSTAGTNPHNGRPLVDGNFTGTTDEILQWAACKWGIDEDIVRAQAVTESYWFQTAGGDLTNNQADCHADLRTTTGPCPESIGVLQVRYGPHEDAFEDANAIYSMAYNLDYATPSGAPATRASSRGSTMSSTATRTVPAMSAAVSVCGSPGATARHRHCST